MHLGNKEAAPPHRLDLTLVGSPSTTVTILPPSGPSPGEGADQSSQMMPSAGGNGTVTTAQFQKSAKTVRNDR
jgi:hypothetical protein